MEIDQLTARALGFPKPEYTSIERERRWLCHHVPRDKILRTEVVTDLYVTDARLRLREARPIDGAPPLLRLSRKADVDRRTRLVTSIYLPEAEFAILAAVLPGIRIKKLRHRLQSSPGVALLVDEFQDDLRGLILAEAEFKTDETLALFTMPEFADREVTDDPTFSGGHLAKYGRPKGA